jgi:hypothetical protein
VCRSEFLAELVRDLVSSFDDRHLGIAVINDLDPRLGTYGLNRARDGRREISTRDHKVSRHPYSRGSPVP